MQSKRGQLMGLDKGWWSETPCSSLPPSTHTQSTLSHTHRGTCTPPSTAVGRGEVTGFQAGPLPLERYQISEPWGNAQTWAQGATVNQKPGRAWPGGRQGLQPVLCSPYLGETGCSLWGHAFWESPIQAGMRKCRRGQSVGGRGGVQGDGACLIICLGSNEMGASLGYSSSSSEEFQSQ